MPRTANIDQTALIEYLSKNYGDEFGSNAVIAASDHFGVSYPTLTKRLTQYKSGHGRWNLTIQEKLENTFNAPAAPVILTEQSTVHNLVPIKDDNFVSFGNFSDLKKILSSRIFYPVFITGLSGNGKTFSVEQACAQLKRELIRVNITIETDEDDLIGGFRLVNGDTV